jgi:hypothetical protein
VSRRGWGGVVGVGALTTAAFLATSAHLGTAPNDWTPLPGPRGGVELAMVLLVSPSCAASRSPQMADAWRTLVQRDDLARRLRGGGEGDAAGPVTLMGFALGSSPEEGWAFLETFGRFHEVGTGRGSLNSGALRYAVEDFRGPLAVPQIVVIEREFRRDESGGIRRVQERVVRRFRGLGAIEALAAIP